MRSIVPMIRPRLHLPTALLLATGLVMGGAPAAGQTLPQFTATPEESATLFLRSVRAIRWSAATQFLHPATLGRFHELVTFMVEADSSGAVAAFLTGAGPSEYPSLTAAQVFDRAIGAMIDDMPGLMHALYDRDDEVLGHVGETADTAHVVYRTTARLSGAVPEVKVMQLARTPGGWRVTWSDELEVLDAALRGVARSRRPPPPPGGGS